jgi:type IV pilus assembly protein PilM
MNILKGGQSDFFGLDLGTTGVRVVQLKGTGATKALDRYGYAAIEGTAGLSDAKLDRKRIAETVHNLLQQVGLSTKNVAVNLPSSRVFTAITDWDKMPPADLAKTIRYQADSIIPTPPAQSKLDWAIIGDSPIDSKKVEVLLSSVPNDFVETRLEMLESVGLNVVAFEPDSMALTRSMIPTNAAGALMILDIGATSTDLVIAMAGVPHLARAIPIGSQAIVRAAVQSLSIEPSQAEQFVFKFGLGQDKLEGQVYNAILGTVDSLVGEIEKSIKFFQSRYQTSKLEKIIATGGASALPEFPVYLSNKLGTSVEIGNPWANVSFPSGRQNELLAVANHFAVAIGLAERNQ